MNVGDLISELLQRRMEDPVVVEGGDRGELTCVHDEEPQSFLHRGGVLENRVVVLSTEGPAV